MAKEEKGFRFDEQIDSGDGGRYLLGLLAGIGGVGVAIGIIWVVGNAVMATAGGR